MWGLEILGYCYWLVCEAECTEMHKRISWQVSVFWQTGGQTQNIYSQYHAAELLHESVAKLVKNFKILWPLPLYSSSRRAVGHAVA
jgi:hypothetical protein